jgi:hypothetical protein
MASAHPDDAATWRKTDILGRDAMIGTHRAWSCVDGEVASRALFTHAVEIPPRGMSLRGLPADGQRPLSLTG